eukprot:6984589-Alexandrium_andersonii.AAC.1
MEGPSTPADRDGNQYVLTYMCCLCHGVLARALSRPQALGGEAGVRQMPLPRRCPAGHGEE